MPSLVGNKILTPEKTPFRPAKKRILPLPSSVIYNVKLVFFRASTIICASPEEVCAWHENPHNLRQVSPPWIRIDKIDAETSAAPGREFALELAQCGFPMRWRGRWLTVQPPRLLIDGGVDCPFPGWRHAHRFEPHANGCLLTDEVTCGVPSLLSWIPGARLALHLVLWAMFLGRHKATRDFFAK